MAATMIQTRESTGNVPAARLVRDVDNVIHYVDPDATPFLFLLKRAKSKAAKATKVEWMEKSLIPRWDQVNNGAGYTSTATAVIVDNGPYFKKYDVVNVPRTGEKMLVVSVSGNTVTVIRAFDGDGVTGTALVDNDDLQIIGSAHPEGGALPVERTHQESFKYNFTQIFKETFGVTETMKAVTVYGGEVQARQRREGAIYHKIDMERAFLFGERAEWTGTISTASSNNPERALGGVLYYATSNVTDAGGTLTESELEAFMQNVFNATGGSAERLLLVSPGVASIIDQLAGSRLMMVPSDKTGGISISQWQSSHGRLMIVKDRLLENGAGGNGYGGYALALDMSRITYRPLRPTTLEEDIGVAGEDGETDQYITECSIQIENPEVHGILKSVTS